MRGRWGEEGGNEPGAPPLAHVSSEPDVSRLALLVRRTALSNRPSGEGPCVTVPQESGYTDISTHTQTYAARLCNAVVIVGISYWEV